MKKQKDDLTWNAGPPPSLGWWPASGFKMPGIYRWWNGRFWSKPASKSGGAAFAVEAARNPAHGGTFFEWQHRPASWPARSLT